MVSRTIKENGNGAFAVGLRWCSRWLGAFPFLRLSAERAGTSRIARFMAQEFGNYVDSKSNIGVVQSVVRPAGKSIVCSITL